MKGRFRVLFIGYWEADDGLTSSTIVPNLKILRSLPETEALYFTNIQRGPVSCGRHAELAKITDGYFPLFSRSIGVNVITKLIDFIRFPAAIKDICQKWQINHVIARGAPAGALAWLACRDIKIPYSVESFEPHAEYMRLTKTWMPWDLRYIFQCYWENKQKRSAEKLIVVSNHYKEQLLIEGVPATRIEVAPCAVDPVLFYPDSELRNSVRKKLRISTGSIVGVYAGKFGGLYQETRAFEIFERCFTDIWNFHLLLLTPHDKQEVMDQLVRHAIPLERVNILFSGYGEMNGYLNAGDFGFALYKSTTVSQFLSPVKVAEYWAVGLPVLITENVGDECEFIERQKMGLVYRADVDMNAILQDVDQAKIRRKALAIRNFEKVKRSYKQIMG